MSSDIFLANIGLAPNDGTGDPIRNAFANVNLSLFNLDTRISQGNIAAIYDATILTGQQFTSNVSTTKSLNVSSIANIVSANITNLAATSLVATHFSATGNVDLNANLNVAKNVIINGNLTILGSATVVAAADLAVADSIINLHTPANLSPLTFDDGKDIGIVFHYYKGADNHASLIWANDTQSLEFYSSGVENGNNTFSGTYGNIKAGGFYAADNRADAIKSAGGITSNTVTATSATITNVITDKLSLNTPVDGSNVDGSIYVGSDGGTSSDWIFINGVRVATELSSFNGGPVGNLAWFLGGIKANNLVASTSTTSGAFQVDGGVGITGNVYAGAIHNTPISGSSGNFTTLTVASTFAASSVSFSGGFITNVYGDASRWAVADFTSGNVKITGGSVTGLTSFSAASVAITSGTITGITSLSAASVNVTSGSLIGLSQVTTTNLTSANGLVTTAAGARIAGDFSNATVASRLLMQTTSTNGATNITAIPRGTIASTNIASSFRVEDTNSVASGNGASGGIELYQDVDVRIQSAVRGAGTYLPLTVFTGGTKAAQFSTNHDFTLFNTTGAGVITLSANGTITASLSGNADTATTLQTARTINGIGFDGSTNIIVSAAANTLTGTTLAAGVVASSLTSVGTLISLAVSGNVTVGNLNGTIYDNGARVITTTSLSNYGVSKIIAGTNIVISPAGGTGDVTISTNATANAAWLTGSTLSGNVTASSLTSVGTLTSLTTTGDVTVGGNLIVSGDTVSLNVSTLAVEDINVTVAKNATTAVMANGAGLTVAGANATLIYTSIDDRWNVNKIVNGSITNAMSADSVAWANVSSKPAFAASGSYSDLVNKPTFLPGAKYTESTTAPSVPTAGDRWFNTTTDILYQLIGTAWVDVFTAGITATPTATANTIVQRDSGAGAAFNAVTAATLTVSSYIAATGVGTQNIGSATNKFGTIYGVSTSAQYADLAEIYSSDKKYYPGTVVIFGGSAEVTVSTIEYDTRVAGVVSTKPAYLMNDSAVGIPIALTGRVPCQVIGPINKGDVLVTSKYPGIARAINNAKWVPGCTIGKALADVEDTVIATIEVVIGRF